MHVPSNVLSTLLHLTFSKYTVIVSSGRGGGGWEGGREGGRERGGRGEREGRDDCYTYYSDGTTIFI